MTGVKGIRGELILGEGGTGERAEGVSLWKKVRVPSVDDSSRISGVRRDCDVVRACTFERECKID